MDQFRTRTENKIGRSSIKLKQKWSKITQKKTKNAQYNASSNRILHGFWVLESKPFQRLSNQFRCILDKRFLKVERESS